MTSTKVLHDHSMRSSLDMMAGRGTSMNRMPSSSSFDDDRSSLDVGGGSPRGGTHAAASVGGGSPRAGSHAAATAAATRQAPSLGGDTEAGRSPIPAEGPLGSRQLEDQTQDPVTRARAATVAQIHAHGTRRVSESEGTMRTIHSGASLLEEAEQSALLKNMGK